MDSPQGFTLIEMIVVLVILALITSIVMTRGPSRSPTLEVKQAVALVAQAFRGARAQAIAADHSVAVEIDAVHHAIGTGSKQRTLLPATVTIAPSVAIRFAPDGSSSGGGVLLTEGSARTLVTVDSLTGRVRFAYDPRAADGQ
jgi:general secretion pathway protein H